MTQTTTDRIVERDYTCVCTAQLAAEFAVRRRPNVGMAEIAERAELDVRDLKKIVVSKKYRTTGLHLADRILMAVGGNVQALTALPSPGRENAERMARDEWELTHYNPRGVAPSPTVRRKRAAFVAARADELEQLRRDTLGTPG
jgi:hypothetical protein